MLNRFYLSPGKVGANAACNYWSNLESVHQVPIMRWVDRGSVEYEVCTTLLHMANTEESNPRPSDLESNALSTGQHAPWDRDGWLERGWKGSLEGRYRLFWLPMDDGRVDLLYRFVIYIASNAYVTI